MSLSNRDKKLLMILAGVLLVALSYFMVFSPKSAEYSALKTQTSNLESSLAELEKLEAKRGEYEEEIEKMSAKIKDLTAEFPADTKDEDGIFFGYTMESKEVKDLHYSSIALGNPEVVVVTTVPAEGTGETTETETVSEYTMFRSRNSFIYKASYEALKKSLLAINKSTDKVTVQSMNASFDSETGLLMGTFDLNFFTMVGTEREYTAPALPKVKTSTDNIFGTAE